VFDDRAGNDTCFPHLDARASSDVYIRDASLVQAAAQGGRLRSAIAALSIGLAAGIASGMLGVGGGIVMVPLLTLGLGFSQHRAHATSLAAIVPIAAVGATAFALAGEVDYALAVVLAGGSLIGAPLGARLMDRVGEGTLKTMFGLLLLAVAANFFLRP
jgi:uncharacterized membrane protein YfcA